MGDISKGVVNTLSAAKKYSKKTTLNSNQQDVRVFAQMSAVS
jgi:hypothetical protein